MARRHKPPESTHPHRWMVSYADFMTLLFAFFVVMYAVSVVNNQKFERMSHALIDLNVEAFYPAEQRPMAP